MSSRLAPPPVETCVDLVREPACSTAATESPPPTTVIARRTRDRLARPERAGGERRLLEHAHRAVPEHRRARRRCAARKRAARLRADVESHQPVRDRSDRLDRDRPRRPRTLAPATTVDRQQRARSRARHRPRARASPRPGPSRPRPATRRPRSPVGPRNVYAIAPPIRIASAFASSVSSTPILSDTLAPPDDRDERPLGRVEQPAERLELLRRSRPAAARQEGAPRPRSRRGRGARRRTRRSRRRRRAPRARARTPGRSPPRPRGSAGSRAAARRRRAAPRRAARRRRRRSRRRRRRRCRAARRGASRTGRERVRRDRACPWAGRGASRGSTRAPALAQRVDGRQRRADARVVA